MTYSLGIVMAGHGPEAARRAFDALTAVGMKGAKLLLFTDHRFDGGKQVSVRNVEGDYPADLVVLRNMALMAKASGATGDYFRDGFEVLCLHRAVQKEARDCFVLLRDSYRLSEADTAWLRHIAAAAFKPVGQAGQRESYVVDCRLESTRRAIAVVAELYLSGAVLSLSDTSLGHALRLAVEAASGDGS